MLASNAISSVATRTSPSGMLKSWILESPFWLMVVQKFQVLNWDQSSSKLAVQLTELRE